MRDEDWVICRNGHDAQKHPVWEYCPLCPKLNIPMGKPFPKVNPVNDPVNHPKHYTEHPSGVECIQITRHMGFNLGNAMKYVWRADLKNGVEDLRKAIWYLQDEVDKRNRLNK